jgi:hypothetical protein
MLRIVALVKTDVSEEGVTSIRLIVTANIVASSPILVALMTEAIYSSEMSVPLRATRLSNLM